MLQPNCSELVIWLNHMAPEEIAEAVKRIAKGHPVLDGTRLYNIGTSVRDASLLHLDVFPSRHDRNRARGMMAGAKDWLGWVSRFYRCSLSSIHSAGLWVNRKDSAVWYHQHCQPQGFPLLRDIEEELGGEVWADDGGDTSDYERWKRRKRVRRSSP